MFGTLSVIKFVWSFLGRNRKLTLGIVVVAVLFGSFMWYGNLRAGQASNEMKIQCDLQKAETVKRNAEIRILQDNIIRPDLDAYIERLSGRSL